MNKNSSSFEKAFDMLLTDAAIIANENLGASAGDDKNEPEFSAEHMRKMEKLFNSEFKKIRREKFITYSKRAACVLPLAFTVTAVSIFSVSAFRTKVINFVFNPGAINTDYGYDDEQYSSYKDDNIELLYIPDDFVPVYNSEKKDSFYLTFENNGLYYFTVVVNTTRGRSNTDTEEAVIETVRVNDKTAIYISNKNINSIIWNDEKYSYSVYGNIEKDELIRISERLIFKKF